MSDGDLRRIDEQPGRGRLGRHVEHDPRSRAYGFLGGGTPAVPIKSVKHRRYGAVLDQGDTGSCTGNGTAHAINTAPLHVARTKILREVDAVAVYSLATRLDAYPGVYPPDDTGSSGLAAAKAAKQLGYIAAYKHAFSPEEALQALQHGPVITGVNWYEGFDAVDPSGLVTVAGHVRGGHEFCIVGLELGHDTATFNDALVIAVNSWGKGWGVGGRFQFTVADWRLLLSEQGDATILL